MLQQKRLPNELWCRIILFAFNDDYNPEDVHHQSQIVRERQLRLITISFPVQILRVNQLFHDEGRRVLYGRPVLVERNDYTLDQLEIIGADARNRVVHFNFSRKDDDEQKNYQWICRMRSLLPNLQGVSCEGVYHWRHVPVQWSWSAPGGGQPQLPLWATVLMKPGSFTCLRRIRLKLSDPRDMENNPRGRTLLDNIVEDVGKVSRRNFDFVQGSEGTCIEEQGRIRKIEMVLWWVG